MAKINFFSESLDFTLPHPRKTAAWITAVIKKEKQSLQELNYIFCADEHLHKINQEYLNHNTYTDIITFDNSEESGKIEGDIFISIDRVKDNAVKYKVDFLDELHRVIIHGTLHLLGYGDKAKADKELMREKEDTYLSLRK
jgi:probable rRNA maturation factor